MKPLGALAFFGLLAGRGFCSEAVSAAAVADSLSRITLDPEYTYQVRDLQLRRGDVTFYFTEGLLSFATPVNGKRIAAVFTTSGIEAGDAEVVLLPPQAAERASLASFAKSPNLDEHFHSAMLYFSDRTADELLTQARATQSRKTAEITPQLRSSAESILRSASGEVKTRMVSAILDPGAPENGFFYAGILGREVGSFDVLYEPGTSEPVVVGNVVPNKDGSSHFELWASYRPRSAGTYRRPAPVISDYSIDATVQPNLNLAATASFQFAAHAETGRVLSLSISRRMHIETAAVDGEAVEVFQHSDEVTGGANSDAEFLLVLSRALDDSRSHRIEVRYSGAIISQVDDSSYFVSERNLWYPHTETMLTNFDLRFHCPERLEIVSTGGAVSESVEKAVRTVHRRTTSPQQMAGFNLGEYQRQVVESAPYRIESYADRELKGNFNGIPQQAAQILRHYTRQWGELSDRSLAITPIPGDFGQGFPGLIYLGRLAYLAEAERPAGRRTEQDRTFFSNLLLPHELAHQWWGNMVTPEGYRSEWLMEAMSNDSALESIANGGNAAIAEAVLEQYRSDLGQMVGGKTLESSGPVDFGSRILTTAGFPAWQTVVYKKGTWILRMLRSRMGNAKFIEMQADLLRRYAGKPITNDEFRKIASRYIPANQPDRELELFFETWVYSTGIPRIGMNRAGTKLQVKGVDEAFSVDLPLRCKSRDGVEQVRWLRIEAGENASPAAGCKLPSPLDFLYLPL